MFFYSFSLILFLSNNICESQEILFKDSFKKENQMARVTIEDCIEKVPSRFELVMLAAQRARKIGAGAPLLIERDNDKNPVVALREIAEDKIDPENMREDLIKSHQRVASIDEEDEEEMIDLMDGEDEWGGSDDNADTSDKPPSLHDLAGISPSDND